MQKSLTRIPTPSFLFHSAALGLLVGLAIVVCAPPAAAQGLSETRAGLFVSANTPEGEPVEDVEITLTPRGTQAAPLNLETNRRGRATFPRLQLLDEGYDLGVEKEGWYVESYLIRTRRGTREIYQEDSGRLNPRQQLFPPIYYRGIGTNAIVELVMQPVSAYEPPAPKAEAKPEAVPKPQAPARRDLTPLEKADEAMALRDYGAAAGFLEEAIDEGQDTPDLRWRLALTQAEAGNLPAAMREANRVLQAEPERPGVRLQLARWMSEMGQPAIAVVAQLEKERELSPGEPELLETLASAYREAGREEDADAAVEAWANAEPNSPEALIALADVRTRAGDMAGAEELYRQIAEADPTNAARMFYNVGATIMNRRNITAADRSRAIAAFEKSIEADEGYALSHLQLGYALLGTDTGRGAALEHFRRFLELAPNDPRAGEAKGMVDALSGS